MKGYRMTQYKYDEIKLEELINKNLDEIIYN